MVFAALQSEFSTRVRRLETLWVVTAGAGGALAPSGWGRDAAPPAATPQRGTPLRWRPGRGAEARSADGPWGPGEAGVVSRVHAGARLDVAGSPVPLLGARPP